jgi:ATP-dependent exoDNAse (exonuclease V) beta subunit
VLPRSLQQLLERAGSALEGVTTLGWEGISGTRFEWQLCRAEDGGRAALARGEDAPLRDLVGDRPLPAPVRRLPVTEWIGDSAPGAAPRGAAEHALTGTLVHRLFGAADAHAAADGTDWLAVAARLLRPEERVAAADLDAVLGDAVAAWKRLRERPDVSAVLRSGEAVYEVPFSLLEREDGMPVILRGAIDCLVRRPDGSLVVVELKTGRPNPAHERQLDLYVRAAQTCYPDAAVERLLVYL